MNFPNITYAFLFAGAIFGLLLNEEHNAEYGQCNHKVAAGLAKTALVVYDSNWAGAVLNNTGYTSVFGTITVPTIPSNYSFSRGNAWVGIDGYTCPNILQTGIGWVVQEDGSASYWAWYEWLPAPSVSFTDIPIVAGDLIQMSVTATSTTSGNATIENLTTGVIVTHELSGETHPLCQSNAEWIVEDSMSCYDDFNECELTPFADFGTVQFTNCSAVENGLTVMTSGATIFNIKQHGEVLTNCSACESAVTCSYMPHHT